MGLIKVVYDPAMPKVQQHEKITMPLLNPAPGETDNAESPSVNQADLQQTLIYGIQCPIICINGLVVAYDDIISFELLDTDHLPTMSCHIYDNKNLVQQLLPPSQGNTQIIVQIIPPMDKYKKIDICFILTDFSVGLYNDLYLSASYNIPDFTCKNYKSLGEISLYDLYDKFAKDMGWGFATNTENKDDKRYVFCTYTSYMDTLNYETDCTGEKEIIYDWWVDLWHYLVFEDLYERYKTLDSSNDINVWLSNQINDVTSNTEIVPYECEARLTNRFGMENSQLYIKDYRVINNIGADIIKGTDKVYSVYSIKDKKYEDTLFVDSSVPEQNIVKNFEYKGEVYGEYDYITNSLFRIPFLQKMKKEMIEVDLVSPLLGLARGKQVILEIYQNEGDWDASMIEMEKEGIIKPYTNVNPIGNPIDMVDSDEKSKESDHFKLDKTLSTQYLIVGNKFKYVDHHWTHTVVLVRPDDRKVKLMSE